jgi:hypothetical protein
MEQEKERRIVEGHRTETCPECGKALPSAADRVGPGALADGIFCDLACQIAFHKDYYRERARASNPSQN